MNQKNNQKEKLDKKITDKIFNSISGKMPKISETEQAAIDAGNTWIEGDIFKANIQWNDILSMKKDELTKEESNFIKNKVIPLLKAIDNEEINKNNNLTDETWNYLKNEKFFSFIIPKEYGGLGFSAKANSTIVAMLASVSSTLAVTVMVPNSLGPAELLLKYGTEKQKNKWLNNLATGKDIPCFGLTSEEAGSDAGALVDSGIIKEKSVNGKKTLGIELNFNKRYITLAPVSTVMGLAFKLYDPKKLIGEKEEIGITLALIPTSTKGIDNSERHDPMGLSFMNGPIKGKNVFIPIEDIIGGKDMAGKGWNMLVECLSAGRGISLPALSGAISQNCLRITTAYSLIREQFNTPIHNFEGIQESLLKIISNNHIINSLREFTNKALDSGNHPSVVSAITKYHTTELARESLQETMDILGGKAIIQGNLNPISDGYKGMPVAITVEGANILTRYLMIFGQGSIRCHEFLLKEIDAINNEDKNKGKEDFNIIFKNHLKTTTKKSLISFFSGLTYLLINPSPDGLFKKEIKKINHLSRALNITSDITLLDLGGKLKYKEYLSSRLGDVLSNLFMAISVIYNNQNNKDNQLSKYCVQLLISKAEKSLSDFYLNYDSNFKSVIMKNINYPLGFFKTELNFKDNKNIVDLFIYNKDKRNSEIKESFEENKVMIPFEIAYDIHLDYHLNRKELKNKIKGKINPKLGYLDNIDLLKGNDTITTEEKDFLYKLYKSKVNVIKVNSNKK